MERTLEEIRTLGLEALRDKLGTVGMVRFIQQFQTGRGDYAKERRKWVEGQSVGDLKKAVLARRKSRKKSKP
jgi:hypothetical protein